MPECYLCGAQLAKRKNKSKDHVPPDCIFPRGAKPPNLITVPCCISCNMRFKTLDERMRNFVAILADTKSGDAGAVARELVLKSRRLRKEFLSHTKEHPTMMNAAGHPRRLFFFDDKELDEWLIRIVRGLFFHRNKRRISENATYKVAKFPQFAAPSSEGLPMEEGLKHRPYFVYSIVHDDDRLNTDVWVLVFYDHLIFTITVERRP